MNYQFPSVSGRKTRKTSIKIHFQNVAPAYFPTVNGAKKKEKKRKGQKIKGPKERGKKSRIPHLQLSAQDGIALVRQMILADMLLPYQVFQRPLVIE
ncbi:hypothetical protein CEXT_582941 [Caerostris extrusa]|uniref:Uncharacterized protein n=1 Tax=Caerostris extrusa TaxID=172846 RepID=A0AAV4RLS9_CAEEX|nr:hypothetical protein CEXT_582941 [Caerostris extrusa]